MALCSVRVRLQTTGATQRIDPVFGSKTNLMGQQFGVEIILRGQPRFDKEDHRLPLMAGDGADTRGYVVFSMREITGAGLTPEQLKNARITGYRRDGSWTSKEYEIIEVRHRGHLTGGPILIKCMVQEFDDLRGSL